MSQESSDGKLNIENKSISLGGSSETTLLVTTLEQTLLALRKTKHKLQALAGSEQDTGDVSNAYQALKAVKGDGWKVVQVVAEPTVPLDELHEDDLQVPGVWAVEVKEYLPEFDLADTALDGFHASIAVKNLDDFKVFARTLDGKALEPQEDHECYSGEHLVGDNWFVETLDLEGSQEGGPRM